MAKGRPAFPLDLISGAIQGNDRTVGRDKGFTLVIRENSKPTKADQADRLTVNLVATKAPTKGGSTARHARSQVYCDCDRFYANISDAKRAYLLPWWLQVSARPAPQLSNYTVWMKICMKNLIEKDVFLYFAWVSRYLVTNPGPDIWTDQQVQFTDIKTHLPDFSDARAFQLVATSTEKDGTTLDPRMIWSSLPISMTSADQALVTIPSLAPGASMLVDIYSYAQG